MRTRRIKIIAALAAAAVAALLLLRPWAKAPAFEAEAAGGALAAGADATARATSAAAPLPADPAEMVAFLRARYGKHIGSAYVQIQMLEKLMRHFQAKNPAGWQDELLAAVRAAFPERYAELAAMLQHRLDYEAWLRREHDRLRGLAEREHRDALWEARTRIFGAEAADEIWASERKNQALADSLAAIDASPDATIGDRLAQYREGIEEAHREDAEAFLQQHRQEALDRFLALASVQRELSSLSAGDRAAQLRTVRKGLGLDDAALDRWGALDGERDRRWQQGLAYMAERTALAQRLSGGALEAQLQALRARYFGAEAGTIADEEAAGFFRFSGPRRYGLN